MNQHNLYKHLLNINKLTYQVRDALFKVHRILGSGLLEVVYEAALAYELVQNGRKDKTQAGLPVVYENVELKLR
ncbi:GxxExxY protein [Niabella sp. CC-SYL272]|uniref:GxxExxY protein n=1 Tax=Niabella agricola TaxID=2891571 RepID=UPI001F289091|nr:GxxExxY protein [Niabella agricola]MCF3110870.1 GxxExxY protein [Niabella agricola]